MILRLVSKRILLASSHSNASARLAQIRLVKKSGAASVSFRSKTFWAGANSAALSNETGHASSRDSIVGRLVAAPQLALAYDYIDDDDDDGNEYAISDRVVSGSNHTFTTPPGNRPSSAAPYPPPPLSSSAPSPPGSTTTTARKTTDGGGGGGGGPGGGGRHRCPKVR